MRLILLFCVFLISNQSQAQHDFTQEVERIVASSSEKGYETPVIFIGSSSIRMWKSLSHDFPEFEILNHGFGGSEYSDLLKYQEQLIGEFEPSMVVVYAGDNDIANGKKPASIQEEADSFVDGLRRLANGSPVIVLSAKPSIARWELSEKYVELNNLLEEMANQYEHVVFVDVWNPMLLENGELNKSLFIQDGLHMNEKGYEIWKNALKPFLSR